MKITNAETYKTIIYTMITNKQHNKQIEIDLTGPDGNAFTLMGQVKGWCKQMSIR